MQIQISIGTAAAKVQLSVSALRKYEKEGLLLFHRTDSGRRLLSRSDIRRIQMIQRMINDLGLNIEGIRRLLALLPCWNLKPCTAEERAKCMAVAEPIRPCWMVADTECSRAGADCRVVRIGQSGGHELVGGRQAPHGECIGPGLRAPQIAARRRDEGRMFEGGYSSPSPWPA